MTGIPGIAQLDIALDVIEKHPETHNQGTWACGTQFCVAGHLAILDGADASGLSKPTWEDRGYESIGSFLDTYLQTSWSKLTPEEILAEGLSDTPIETDTLTWPDGTDRVIYDEARRILGVDKMTAGALFGASNTVKEIKAMRNWLAENESIAGFTDADGYTYNPLDY